MLDADSRLVAAFGARDLHDTVLLLAAGATLRRVSHDMGDLYTRMFCDDNRHSSRLCASHSLPAANRERFKRE